MIPVCSTDGEDKPDDHWVYYGLNDFSQYRKDQLICIKSKVKEFKERKEFYNYIPSQKPIIHVKKYGTNLAMV